MERTYEHWDEFLVICYIAIDSIDSQGGKKKLSDELGSMITHKKYTCPLVICYIAIEKGPFIVDLPMKDGDFPVRYVCLPEGNHEVIWEKPRRTIRRWALHVNIIRLLLPCPLVIKTWLAGKSLRKMEIKWCS